MDRRNTDDDEVDPAPLRRSAERRLGDQSANLLIPHTVDATELLHELEVHQIEFQIQNEELRKLVATLDERLAACAVDLAAARDAAEASNRAKNTFIANMNHEIRTPLNGILGTVQLLRLRGVSQAQAEKLDQIESCGHDLMRVIDNVLDFSKMEACKLQLKQNDFTLSDLVQGITAIVTGSVTTKGLTFLFDVAGMPQFLYGDRGQLSHALLNYIGNAIKFTDQGSITLKGRLLEETAAGYQLRFEVIDTGIGIAPKQQTRLFEAFAQVDDSLTRRFGGTGLGLAMTRRIAQLMGGKVGVISTLGQGSTFWMTVQLGKGRHPAGPAEPEAEESAEAILRRECCGTRVLVVDDEAINREVILTFLQGNGQIVDLAEDGLQAVELATRNSYDLILMDIQMPNMDGLEATSQIRKFPNGSNVPIVAITANVFAENRARCFNAGMNEFVAKPVDPDKLFGILLKWLAQPKSLRRFS